MPVPAPAKSHISTRYHRAPRFAPAFRKKRIVDFTPLKALKRTSETHETTSQSNYSVNFFFETASARPFWPNRDPLGEKGGINLFCMVKNDTVNKFDAYGLAITGYTGTPTESYNAKLPDTILGRFAATDTFSAVVESIENGKSLYKLVVSGELHLKIAYSSELTVTPGMDESYAKEIAKKLKITEDHERGHAKIQRNAWNNFRDNGDIKEYEEKKWCIRVCADRIKTIVEVIYDIYSLETDIAQLEYDQREYAEKRVIIEGVIEINAQLSAARINLKRKQDDLIMLKREYHNIRLSNGSMYSCAASEK